MTKPGPIILALSLFAIFTLCLASTCNTTASASDNAEEFLMAMSQGDFETAKIHVDEDGEKVIMTIEKSNVDVDGADSKVTIVGETKDGNKAIVRYKYNGDEEVKTIRLKTTEDEEWQVIVDGDTEEVIIGSESIKEILGDLNLTIQEALNISEESIEEALKAAGEALEISGKTLKDVSKQVSKDLKDAGDDLKAASEDIKDAMKEIQEAFEENKNN